MQGRDERKASLMSRKKVSRNDPCPCGSGKKYKHCCYKNMAEGDLGASPNQQQYPIGTVAMYGPDDKTTTKMAAAVILHENAEPIVMRWVATDVTTNPKIQQEIKDFFLKHGVKGVAMSEGNMGCPHEEGEDFPDGGDCPFCPFWKGKQGSSAFS
jgi:SEC-C motif